MIKEALVSLTLLIPYAVFAYTVFGTGEPVWSHEIAEVEIPPKPLDGKTLVVDRGGGGDFTSIGAAVANAKNGDRIVIKAGVYRESVVVNRKAWLTIEGVDRDSVVLDGEMRLGNGIYVVFSPHVRIANLTVRNYLGNGIFYVSSDYFEVSNVKAANNRVYGVNFLASEKGKVSHVIAYGSGDSGIYVGEVTEECDCIIEYSEAFNNSLGYSGTRANGVTIRNSHFHDNAVGVAPNTLLPNIKMFLLGKWPLMLSASKNTIENNLIENNNNRRIKAAGFAASYGVPVGVGIALIGSHSNVVRENTIRGNEKCGVAEWYFLFPPIGNTYLNNIFNGNGADYWRDGWGFLGCSLGEDATGDKPPSCTHPSLSRLTIPNPLKHIELLMKVEVPTLSIILIPVVGLFLVAVNLTAKRQSRANRWRHLTASFVDALLVGDIYLVIATSLIVLGFGITDFAGVVDGVLSLTLLLLPLAYFLWTTTWVFYGMVMEAAKGSTVGKSLLNLRIYAKGARPRAWRIVVRNLARYFDLLFFGAVGVVAVVTLGRSIGDLLAGTVVEKKAA